MKILGIAFQNFKKFQDVSVNFNRQLSVLIGKNNSGKSSFLSGIAEIMGSPVEMIPPILSKRLQGTGPMIRTIDLQLTIQEWAKLFQMYSNLVQDSVNDEEIQEITSRLSRSILRMVMTANYVDSQLPTGAQQQYDLIGENPVSSFEGPQQVAVQRILGQFTPNVLNQIGGITFVSANRNLQGSEKFIPFDRFVNESNRQELVRNGLYFLKKKKNNEFKKLVNKIKSIFPEIDDFDVEHNEDTGFVDVKFTENGINSEMTEMGSGTKSILLILARILSPDTKIALLDEPDVNMHPGLVRDFVKFLEEISDTKQIILSSHHETFVNEVEPVNILHVVSEGESSTITPLSNESDVKNLLEDIGITEIFEQSEAVTSKVIVLSEGKTDEKYVLEFAEKLKILDRYLAAEPFYHKLGGRKIIDANLIDTINGSRQSFLLLLDKDEYDEKSIEETKTKIGNDRVHILKKREIENYALDYKTMLKAIQKQGTNPKRSESIKELTEPKLREKVFSLSNELKNKVILLRFVRKIPFMKLYSDEKIGVFVRQNQNKTITDAVNAFSSEIYEKFAELNPSKLKEIASQVEEETSKEWTEDTVLDLCPAKDLLKLINRWLNHDYHIAISFKDLIRELDYVDSDMSELINKIIHLGKK